MSGSTFVVGALLAAGLVGVAAATAPGTPSLAAGTTCEATRVQGSVVRAGPFEGHVTRAHDVVGGRFSLRAGGFRTPALTSKLPWFVARRYRVADSVRITGRRLDPPGGKFSQSEAIAWGGSRNWVFPSIIDPPSAGCWRLTFRSGNAAGTLRVLVRPAVTRAD